MWTRQRLYAEVFNRKPFTTKKEFLDKTPYKKYDQIRQYFDGLETLPGKRVYLSMDVIDRIMELREFGE